MTPRQRAAVAAYHWWGEFIVCITECREVWLLSTHQRTKLVRYQDY